MVDIYIKELGVFIKGMEIKKKIERTVERGFYIFSLGRKVDVIVIYWDEIRI